MGSSNIQYDGLYPFHPVMALPWIFVPIVAIIGIANIWQNFFRYHWKHYGFIMTWASTIWVAGFVCRGISQANTGSINWFIAQYCLTFLAPPVYGAAETLILGRLMAYLPYAAPMHPGRVVSTFMILSTVVETIGAVGSAEVAGAADGSDPSQLALGLHLMQASLCLACAVEVLFFTITAYTHWNASKAKTVPRNVKIILAILYTTSLMLLVRCIFRAVQSFQEETCTNTGNCAISITNQTFFWVLEVANITLFVVILTVVPPGSQLPNNNTIFLDPTDAKTERRGPGFSNADERPLILTILDPFNIQGMISGKKTEAFWLEHHPLYEGDGRHMYRSYDAESRVSAKY